METSIFSVVQSHKKYGFYSVWNLLNTLSEGLWAAEFSILLLRKPAGDHSFLSLAFFP